jgi:hypothetical protein
MTTKSKTAATEEAKSTEVVVATSTAIMAPDFMGDEDFGSGFEGTDKDSFAIPFLQILQKMSPLVDEDSPKHIEGAKAGMLYNTVTHKLYDGKAGITVIPCFYKRSYVQWGGREAADGGFKGEFTPEQIVEMQNRGEIVVHEGKLLKPLSDGSINEKKSDYFADTRSHFVIIVDPENGEIGQAILALSASQVKASKMLMTSLQQKKVDTPRGKMTPPTFANVVKVTTVGMSNDKGSWSGVRFDLEGLVTDQHIFSEAKAFYKAIAAGDVKADHSKSENQTTGNVSDAPATADGF